MSAATGLERHFGAINPRWSTQQTNDLTEAQCRGFERDGFLVGLDVLSADEANELGARLAHLGDDLESHRHLLYEIEAAWLERPGEVVHCRGPSGRAR